MEAPAVEVNELDKPFPLALILAIPLIVGGLLAVVVFPLAGNWRWLEGWIFVVSFSVTMAIGYAIINQRNPRVMRNRMKVKKEGLTSVTEKAAGSDRWVFPVMSLGFFGAMMLPALGYRLGWGTIPFGIEMAAMVLANLGVILLMVAMLQNSFASKVLDINQDQMLVDTGLYGKVRHPLYAGGILMIMPIPVALGLWWGLVPALIGALTLVVRIKFEEEMLVEGMEGYQEYQQRVKYKLIPGIF
jgi:protein-S-isoprenylcysteine O-methyltransferase Ste14